MATIPKVQWFNTMTLGNALTIATLIVGGFIYVTNIQAQQELMEQRFLEMRVTVAENRALSDARAAADDARLRALEITYASVASDVRNIQAGVNEIRTSLNQILNERP